MLIAEPAFGDDPIAVEDWIHLSSSVPREHISPSVEAQVSLDGRVTVTYVSGQTLGPHGNFTGVVIDYRGLPRQLIDQMERVAAFVGSRLAEFGYAGYFDIDFVIGQDLELYAVEGNLRRTGGTHAHESASAVLGASYMEHSAVLSRDDILMAPLPGGWAQLKERIDDLLVSPSSRTRGVVPTVVTDISSGRIGYVLLAENRAEAAGLERVLLDRIGAVGNA